MLPCKSGSVEKTQTGRMIRKRRLTKQLHVLVKFKLFRWWGGAIELVTKLKVSAGAQGWARGGLD